MKRWFDVAVASIMFLICLPVLALAMICIYIDSPGPVFYKQERVGYKGKLFKVVKLRSMRLDAEKDGPRWAQKHDPRVTRVGAFLRSTRIDELPQLLNVIRGEMSLIGPRPERPMFVEQFNREIPGFQNRLLMKPGLTGWAQVNGGYDISPEEKLELDLYYIRNASLWLDLRILARTVKVVLTGEGAR
jgi:exopolysaccharide biosynthesis polyprenyl glycosylphosphotransferase